MRLLFNQLFITIILAVVSVQAEAQQKGDPPTVKELIVVVPKVTRTELINLVEAADCAMIFKAQKSVDGLSIFLGIDNYKTSLEIQGNDENYTSTKWTMVFNNYKPIDYLEFQRMSYFAYLMAGSKGVEFLNQQVGKFIKDPTQAFSGTTHLEGYGRIEVSYQPKDKALVMSFNGKE